ncbi:MAG: ribonuclease HI family protein [Rubrivivax sp.]|nr:MAG: ribonuclease HI family protein [Rubrivivax sp.]
MPHATNRTDNRDTPWVIHCDGSAVPNPGRMGLGAVMTAPDGTRHTLSLATHTTGCNNEAELRALMAALRELPSRGATTLTVYSDNAIVVEQLGGGASHSPAMAGGAPVAPIARLAALFDEARGLLAAFDRATVHWIPRHRNAEADALARAALGLLPKAAAASSKRKRR